MVPAPRGERDRVDNDRSSSSLSSSSPRSSMTALDVCDVMRKLPNYHKRTITPRKSPDSSKSRSLSNDQVRRLNDILNHVDRPPLCPTKKKNRSKSKSNKLYHHQESTTNTASRQQRRRKSQTEHQSYDDECDEEKSTKSTGSINTTTTSCSLNTNGSKNKPPKQFDTVYDLFDELILAGGLPKSKHDELESILQMGDRFFTLLDHYGLAKDITSIGFARRRRQRQNGKDTTSLHDPTVNPVVINIVSDTEEDDEQDDDEDIVSDDDDIIDDYDVVEDELPSVVRKSLSSTGIRRSRTCSVKQPDCSATTYTTTRSASPRPRRFSLPTKIKKSKTTSPRSVLNSNDTKKWSPQDSSSSSSHHSSNRRNHRRTSLPSDIDRTLALADSYIAKQPTIITQVKGIPASIGIRKGHARIIQASDDLTTACSNSGSSSSGIGKVQRGDILILAKSITLCSKKHK